MPHRHHVNRSNYSAICAPALIFYLLHCRYREGMLKAKVDDEDTVKLIEGAAAGMVATIDRHGTNAVQDWEVDELLEWTTSLNFDE